jgi:RNA polymerase sigma-19 factor, ECF subfamily
MPRVLRLRPSALVFEEAMSKAEERAAVARLFVDHRDRLQQYLRSRLANEDDAAELAQEAYLRILRVKRADLIRHPQAYLFRIAQNLLHELYSGRSAKTDVDVELDLLESGDRSPHELAVLKSRQQLIEKAIQELPVKCQAALLLHWHEGLTQAEIGKRLQLSRQMVQKYLARGLAHCQKRLRRFVEVDQGVTR